jgi:hypothetical protein
MPLPCPHVIPAVAKKSTNFPDEPFFLVQSRPILGGWSGQFLFFLVGFTWIYLHLPDPIPLRRQEALAADTKAKGTAAKTRKRRKTTNRIHCKSSPESFRGSIHTSHFKIVKEQARERFTCSTLHTFRWECNRFHNIFRHIGIRLKAIEHQLFRTVGHFVLRACFCN